MRRVIAIAIAILTTTAWSAAAAVTRYTFQHTERHLPTKRIPQFIVCDFESESPTNDVGEGDLAYAASPRPSPSTSTGWPSSPGKHTPIRFAGWRNRADFKPPRLTKT